MTFSKTDNSLTVMVIEDGKNTVLTTTASNPNWTKILAALKNQDQEKLVNLMSVKNTVEAYTESNVVIEDGNVFFKGRQLHGLDVDRLLEFARNGIPFLPLARFLEKKVNNPSFRSINEMYKFLEHREMTITPQGTVIGYKGVSDNYYSIMGNTATIMVSGETDSGGHILNTVGADIRCDRSCVCDDYRQGCSPGLHIGSLSYAKGWGTRVMIVEFDPADVVSVPDDCECQKLRACAYKVIGEYKGEAIQQTDIKNEVNPPEWENDPEVDEDNDWLDTDDDGECNCAFCNPVKDGPDSTDTGHGDEDDAGCGHIVSENNTSYEDGYTLGEKEGKAHKARKHYITDEDDETLTPDEMEYIEGYNDGYRKSRYNK